MADSLKGDSKIRQFLDYFIRTWMGRTNQFSYDVVEWNHFYNNSPRTNNHAEGHNNAIGHALNKVSIF